MIFTASVTTPKNTSKAAPVKTTIPIVFGKITQVMVWFPPGVNSLCHVKMLWGLVQIFPSNEQGDITAGGVLITWPEDIDITTQPAAITVVTYNEDGAFDHTINVFIVVRPADGNTNAADVATQLLSAQQVGGLPSEG